jgi:hypothetical protein
MTLTGCAGGCERQCHSQPSAKAKADVGWIDAQMRRLVQIALTEDRCRY